MKKLSSIILVIVIVAAFAFPASANEYSVDRKVEYLSNGDYIVTELHAINQAFLTRSTKSGNKTRTYYNAGGTRMWDVVVNGNFSYTYGVSSSATSSSAIVNIYHSGVNYVSKSAWTSGNTASASGTINYQGLQQSMTVSISCDNYGNLS